MKWITAEECKEIIANEEMQLIDVRENWEYEIFHVASTHIPMHTVPSELISLDKEKQYLIICKTGRRAEAVANLLESEYGFKQISVLEGGITAWFALTDPSFEIY